MTTLAEDLVNTGSHTRGRERLDRTELARIATARGWRGPAPRDGDVAEARAVRPRLRAVFEAPDEDAAADAANHLVVEAGLFPQLMRGEAGSWHLDVTRPDASLAQWLAGTAAFGLLAVIARGDAHRLHRCAGPGCSSVFVDTSRNSSRRFCSPAVCGNRVHAATYRARHAGREPVDQRRD